MSTSYLYLIPAAGGTQATDREIIGCGNPGVVTRWPHHYFSTNVLRRTKFTPVDVASGAVKRFHVAAR